ncbi:MAG: hypothetical protein IPP44_14140 [Ideonella sp.]|nr:hypothetical protein [Ideonella sp.]
MDKHPNVECATPRVREARPRCSARAARAVAGSVARRALQVGQRTAPGTPLMSMVRWTRSGWTPTSGSAAAPDAPGTTGQAHGRPVRQQVVYTGRVPVWALARVQPSRCCRRRTPRATGSGGAARARARGLDARQLAEHPLRVGLSMEADVDVADQTGAPVLAGTSARASSRTTAFETTAAEADRRVKVIIAGNLGRASGAVPVSAARP